MFKFRVASATLAMIAASVWAEPESATKPGQIQSPFVVAGYLPSYRMAAWSEANVGPLNHILYFHVLPSEQGSIAEDSISPEARKRLAEIRRHTDVRLSVTVGGWGHSENFASVVADEKKRAAMVASLVELCRTTAIDSVDFDWEHPETDDEWKNYVTVVRETREAIEPLGGLVTIAMASWTRPPVEMFDVVDRINLMSYDHDFPHATLEKSTADVERVIEWGCPAEKLVLGIPFYGRSKDWKATAYKTLVADGAASNGDLTESGIAFNNAKTVAAKAKFARERRLAGVMVWEIGQDSDDEKTSLMRVIERAVIAEQQ